MGFLELKGKVKRLKEEHNILYIGHNPGIRVFLSSAPTRRVQLPSRRVGHLTRDQNPALTRRVGIPTRRVPFFIYTLPPELLILTWDVTFPFLVFLISGVTIQSVDLTS